MRQRKIVTIHQPEHMPWTGFFHKMMIADHYVILDSVQYEKDYFQNRNKVIDRNGSVDFISVPVLISNGRWKDPIREIHVNLSHPWQKKYLGKIRGCYSAFPFFKDIYPEISKIISESPATILELNMALIYFFRDILDISTPISFASEFKTDLQASELNLDLCKKHDATIYLSGAFWKKLFERRKFFYEKIFRLIIINSPHLFMIWISMLKDYQL